MLQHLPFAKPQDWTQDKVFMSDLHQQMVKFAKQQLYDPQMAEDAVQEAFLGALKNQQTFARQTALKTWVFAILKHKIIDLMRQNKRLVASNSLQDDEEDCKVDIWDQQFDERGYWHLSERPSAWQQPAESLASDQFWLVFKTCLNALPAAYSRAYMMREFMDLTTEPLAKTFPNNLVNC